MPTGLLPYRALSSFGDLECAGPARVGEKPVRRFVEVFVARHLLAVSFRARRSRHRASWQQQLPTLFEQLDRFLIH